MTSLRTLQNLAWRPLVNRVHTREQFESLLDRAQPRAFLEFRQMRERAMRQTRALLDHLRLDVEGKSCLDIGPGHGDSLDVWRDLGAKHCAFIENNPWCIQHNRLKGYTPYPVNYLHALDRLPAKSFDLIWCYGSVSAEKAYFKWFGPARFRRWLIALDRLAKPGAAIVICPHWQTPGGVRAVAQPASHWMGTIFREQGYVGLPPIAGHNIEPTYPGTWVRHV